MIFEPFTIKNVTFENRLLRSSVGGRMANYDGTVRDTWRNFELRFARGGIGGMISTTLNVNKGRLTPFEYPPIADDRYVGPLRAGISAIKATGVKYIIQIGDPGYAAQMSLFSRTEGSHSSSSGVDLIYGYRNTRTAMTEEQIGESVQDFANAARRVREAGADGLEVTAAKGYIIHQFLNPGINRRTDRWGGSVDNRFRFLEEIVKAVRKQVGDDFLFGIRLSAEDRNVLPLNLRLPLVFPLKDYVQGNTLDQMLDYAKRLKTLGVDFLHICSGFGFPSPGDTPGEFPLKETKIFFNVTRHLSFKAAARSTLVNLIPYFISKPLFNLGWKYKEGYNLDFASRFRKEVGLPVIANGGFQHRDFIAGALDRGDCDLVSMARALIANPDLPKQFQAGRNEPDRPCSYCNRCAARTGTSPLGCYDLSRYDSEEDMVAQIMECNTPDPFEVS
jgi:2,4-dienoyl-CoA reductase-like NADH-dependent reductase (Old Yellow Enzyme family)